MADLEYPYQKYPKHSRMPVALCFAVNTINGRFTEFVGIIDTGASETALTEDVLLDLDIDLKSLPEDDAGGSGGSFKTLVCDFLRIAFVQPVTFKKFWPNGADPVPSSLTQGPFSLLGRDSFLDRCILTFDGPDQMAYIDLEKYNALSGKRPSRAR